MNMKPVFAVLDMRLSERSAFGNDMNSCESPISATFVFFFLLSVTLIGSINEPAYASEYAKGRPEP